MDFVPFACVYSRYCLVVTLIGTCVSLAVVSVRHVFMQLMMIDDDDDDDDDDELRDENDDVILFASLMDDSLKC